jgi:Kef-type K+ transport system membrane component KefB
MGMVLLPIAFAITGTDGLFTTHIFVVVLVVAIFNGLLSVPAELICRWALREPAVVR